MPTTYLEEERYELAGEGVVVSEQVDVLGVGRALQQGRHAPLPHHVALRRRQRREAADPLLTGMSQEVTDSSGHTPCGAAREAGT